MLKKQINIKNPTGIEVTVLNRKILPWEKAPEGQTIEIESARVAEFVSRVRGMNGSIDVEIVEDAKKPAKKSAPKAKQETPKAKPTEKAE